MLLRQKQRDRFQFLRLRAPNFSPRGRSEDSAYLEHSTRHACSLSALTCLRSPRENFDENSMKKAASHQRGLKIRFPARTTPVECHASPGSAGLLRTNPGDRAQRLPTSALTRNGACRIDAIVADFRRIGLKRTRSAISQNCPAGLEVFRCRSGTVIARLKKTHRYDPSQQSA